MKKHAIIPVFIPHRGCPNDCVFCNQKAITARDGDVKPEDVKNIIETYLPTLEGRGLETIELAFFGGSFTGIPMEDQSAFLKVAKRYKDAGYIHKIHMSTRPDYIDERILDNLKFYGADIIELGVQSFDDKVLAASARGHTSQAVYRACDLIKDYSFELGIQLMIGLPEDSLKSCIYSAKETVKLAPSIARLYPTIVLNDTRLLEMYKEGAYTPLTTEDALKITVEMYKMIDSAGINIIRVGLKSTDLITEGGEIQGNTYHPAFRQLVEGEIAKESLENQLIKNLLAENQPPNFFIEPEHNFSFSFYSNGNSFSNMVGNSKRNKLYFQGKYKKIRITYRVDDSLQDGHYVVRNREGY
ncbi:MAG: radical SAM protein [Clostridiales bacterium]|nr:radical SAM protein [Clostridiales bacterium]